MLASSVNRDRSSIRNLANWIICSRIKVVSTWVFLRPVDSMLSSGRIQSDKAAPLNYWYDPDDELPQFLSTKSQCQIPGLSQDKGKKI